MKVGILGCGAYGMALSSILIDNDCNVMMWTKFVNEKDQLETTRKNERVLPGFELSNKINITTDMEKIIDFSDLLIIAIPTGFVEETVEVMKNYVKNQHILIASKGIQQKTGKFLHQIVEEYIDTDKIAILSGPTFAYDVIQKSPMGLSIATKNLKTFEVIKKALSNRYVKVRYTSDVIGVEICGTVKNIIAIATGMLSGINTTSSTQAMFLTEVIHDIEDILRLFNADKKTVLSYSGIGDLLLTCTSEKSRNFCYGKLLGEGNSEKVIAEYTKNNTVEGLYSLKSVHELLEKNNLNAPIISIIYDIVFGDKSVKELLPFLITKD